jgi:predicted nucleotidyltransferase
MSFPEVNILLRELLDNVKIVLGNHFIGMYLFGSLTSGDFDEHSDIDVLIVTDDEISADLFSALQTMHARIALIDSVWATQLEVSYIPRRALRRYDPSQALHPHLDRGKAQSLHVMQHDSDWVIQRYVVRERGVVLAGPDPQALIDQVSANDLRRAMLTLLWWPAQFLDDPADLDSRGYQSYIVFSVCRMLYTIEFGAVISKRDAARWAQGTLGERWIPLIERAWVGRQNPQLKAEADDVNETLDFIRCGLQRSTRFQTPEDDA